MSNWHGWSFYAGVLPSTCTAIHIGPLPGRKRIALYTQDKEEGVHILAWFDTEDRAERFLRWLDGFVDKSNYAQTVRGAQ